MSQSPLDSQGLDGNLSSYRKGWKALNRLLHENKSFSGRETNNAFLNCGEGNSRFADISSAIAWDFPDDARAIGAIDWDFDGDLDYWVTNRSAPRLRLLENTLASDNHFVAFLLEGTAKTTNRDAIGARIELRIKGDPRPHLRTLHAGHSFLSQSSRWVHFGLGAGKEISSITVSWPGGDIEKFTPPAVDGYFRLKQGTPQPTPFVRKPIAPLEPSIQPVPPGTPIARIIPPAGHILPPLELDDGSLDISSPVLIQLWSGLCNHCQAELPHWKEWNDRILVSADMSPESKEACRLAYAAAGFKDEPLFASEDTMIALDAIQSSLVDLWVPLPVPSAFLVSGDREIIAIYRGPIDQNQVENDKKLIGTLDRRDAAAPFPGIWISEVPIGTPLRAANQLLERGMNSGAISYLKEATPRLHPNLSRFEKGDTLFTLGRLLGANAQPKEALPFLKQSMEFLPEDVRVGLLLAQAYADLGNTTEALQANLKTLTRHPANLDLLKQRSAILHRLEQWDSAVETDQRIVSLNPHSGAAMVRLGEALLMADRPGDALSQFKSTLSKHPRELAAAAALSRILSSHPDESVRSPDEALVLAARLCQFTRNKNAEFLLTNAMALCNLSRFKEAAEALELAVGGREHLGNMSVLARETSQAIKEQRPVRLKNLLAR
ncbi:MAG: ASPIC/UnbV domain-containing protein [Verrucomicrobiaceae bacterium]